MTDGVSDERPLSPHLQIWRFTATMATSITHRAAGVALYGGVLILLAWLLGAAFFPGFYTSIIAPVMRSSAGFVITAGLAWSLSFHLMNGLRFLYWDAGRGMAPETARRTSWLIYGLSVIVTAALLWAGYAMRGGL